MWKAILLMFTFLLGVSSRAIDTSQGRPYRIPEYGVELRIPVGLVASDRDYVSLRGNVSGEAAPAHHFGALPYSSKDLLSGMSYTTAIRVYLLLDSTPMREDFAKKFGWAEKPSLDLFPFEAKRSNDLATAVERLYFQIPKKWESVKTTKIGSLDGIEMSGWQRFPDSMYFEEMRAAPIRKGRILLVHSVYKRESLKKLKIQRELVQKLINTIDRF